MTDRPLHGLLEITYVTEDGTLFGLVGEATQSSPEFLENYFRALTTYLWGKITRYTCPHVPDENERCMACGLFVE